MKGSDEITVRDIVVALDWSASCHGIKVRWPGHEVILLSDCEIDDGNDFYPKRPDASGRELADAEKCMDIVSECEVESMRVEDGYLVADIPSDVIPLVKTRD